HLRRSHREVRMKISFRSLYLKIFVWFWLAMIIINVAFFAAVALTRPTPMRRSWRDLAQTGPTAQKAAETFEQAGASALSSTLQATEKTTGVHGALFNEGGTELSGRDAPAGAGELAARSAESRDLEFNFAGPGTLIARPVVSATGQRYTYVAHIPRPPFQSLWQTQAIRLLIILVIGGIFCYWLARYITKPLFKLQTTTNQLAEGDLSARVGTNLAKRRDEVGEL